MKKRIVFFSLFVVLLVVSAYADQRIVGTWVTEARTIGGNNVGQNTFVFNANGTGTVNGNALIYGISVSGALFSSASIPGWGRIHGTIFMSPDGRLMIIDGVVFQRQ